MTFKLGDFFPRKTVNEPFLSLDDSRWGELEGGYRRSMYDASVALKQLELTRTLSDTDRIYKELWNELHHQGDVGIASYYAVPHLVRIAKQNKLVDSNLLGLVSLIEIQRHKDNPKIPGKLLPAYSEAIKDLQKLAMTVLDRDSDFDSVICSLSAIALAKGQLNLADALQRLDSQDQIEDFLENY
jgi:hypothetical protein